MRERDYEKRRKAEQSNTTAGASPADIDFDALKNNDQLKQDLLRALGEKYSKEYELLIRKYFEELQKMNK